MSSIQKITPCLWFDDQAEEAARFYTSVFASSSIGAMLRMKKMDIAAVQRAYEG